jgi:hypothetical protein
MIAVHFSKDVAARFLHAVQTGQPISPPPEGWTPNHLLTLAGMLVATLQALGPQAYPRAIAPPDQYEERTPEHRGPSEQAWRADIGLGAEFISKLGVHLLKRDYDKRFESTVEALVYAGADGDKKFQPLKGFKTLPNRS